MTGKTWTLAATLPFVGCRGPDPIDAGPAQSGSVAAAITSRPPEAELRLGLRGNDRTGRLSCGESHVCWLDGKDRLWCGHFAGLDGEIVLDEFPESWKQLPVVPAVRLMQVSSTTFGIVALDLQGGLHTFRPYSNMSCLEDDLESTTDPVQWQQLAVEGGGFTWHSGIAGGRLSHYPFTFVRHFVYLAQQVALPNEIAQHGCDLCARNAAGDASCLFIRNGAKRRTVTWRPEGTPLIGLSTDMYGNRFFGLRADGGVEVLDIRSDGPPVERVPAPPVPLAPAESIHGKDGPHLRVGDWLMPLGYYAGRRDDTWGGVPILIRPPPGGSPVVDYCSTTAGLCVLRASGDVECFNQRGQPLRFPFVDLLTP